MHFIKKYELYKKKKTNASFECKKTFFLQFVYFYNIFLTIFKKQFQI